MHRSDLSEHAPSFVRNTNGYVLREVRNLWEVKRETWTITASETPLPDDWLAFTSFPLDMLPADHFYRTNVYEETTGDPVAATVDGRTLVIAPAQSNYSLRVSYRAALQLSEAVPTNFLLQTHYDLYLHGVLAEAGAYVRDLELETKHRAEFMAIAKRVNAQQSWAQAS